MRRIAVILATALFAGGCATLPRGGRGDRAQLWQQAHDAFARDSVRVAAAAFQRLANEHPRSYEGHEARFYLGVLALEPRSGLDLSTAHRQLSLYVEEDSSGGVRGYHAREARTLMRLAGDLGRPCAERAILRCAPASPDSARAETPGPEPTATAPAESARLRREIAERDATIRQLREELERIRNTLAPRRTPRE